MSEKCSTSNKDVCDWVFRAVRNVNYGEVILVIHDGEIKRIDTKDRKQVTK